MPDTPKPRAPHSRCSFAVLRDGRGRSGTHVYAAEQTFGTRRLPAILDLTRLGEPVLRCPEGDGFAQVRPLLRDRWVFTGEIEKRRIPGGSRTPQIVEVAVYERESHG